MFRCQMCGKVSGARVKAVKVITASRPKEYKGNIEEFAGRRFGRFRQPSKPRDRGGRGHEIVKELMVCKECAESYREQEAEIIAAAKAAAVAAAPAEDELLATEDEE